MYYNLQKVGEIVVVGPPGSAKQSFLKSFCPEVTIADQDILIGRFPVNSDLVVYIYGISHDPESPLFAWDLVAKKMIGYIVIFDWHNETSIEQTKQILDFTTHHFSTPFVLAADLQNNPCAVPEAACRPYILISNISRFMFFRSTKPATVKKVVISLLDILIHKIE